MRPSSLPTPNEEFVMARVSGVCHSEAEVEDYGARRDRRADPLRSVCAILHLQIPNTLKPGLV